MLSILDETHEQQPSRIRASALGACNNCFSLSQRQWKETGCTRSNFPSNYDDVGVVSFLWTKNVSKFSSQDKSSILSTSIKSQEMDFQTLLQTQINSRLVFLKCVLRSKILFMMHGINIIMYVDALWRHSHPTGLSQRKHLYSLRSTWTCVHN